MKRTLVLTMLCLALCLPLAVGEQVTAVVRPDGAEVVALRWMPLVSSSAMAYVPRGASVVVESEKEDWLLVTYERKTGYMLKSCLILEPSDIGDALIEDASDAPDAGVSQPLGTPMTQGRARDIADAALIGAYIDFLPSEYAVVQAFYRENMPSFGTYYDFEYFGVSSIGSYRCFVDAYTGGVLLLSSPRR